MNQKGAQTNYRITDGAGQLELKQFFNVCEINGYYTVEYFNKRKLNS